MIPIVREINCGQTGGESGGRTLHSQRAEVRTQQINGCLFHVGTQGRESEMQQGFICVFLILVSLKQIAISSNFYK